MIEFKVIRFDNVTKMLWRINKTLSWLSDYSVVKDSMIDSRILAEEDI